MNAARKIPRGFLVSFVSLLLIVAVATSLSLIVRLRIVEPEQVALACVGENTQWRCSIRQLAVLGFLNNVYGWVAVLTGVLATISRWRWLAVLALLAGIVGSVLYTFELSGAGLLLGALVFVQRPPLSNHDGPGEQGT